MISEESGDLIENLLHDSVLTEIIIAGFELKLVSRYALFSC